MPAAGHSASNKWVLENIFNSFKVASKAYLWAVPGFGTS